MNSIAAAVMLMLLLQGPVAHAATGADTASDTMGSDVDRAVGWLRDSWVTAQIELRLLTNRDVNVADVRVKTREGIVTLEGTVPNQSARAAAQDDARRVDGVKSVVNHLRVTSEAAGPPGDPRAPADPSSGSL